MARRISVSVESLQSSGFWGDNSQNTLEYAKPYTQACSPMFTTRCNTLHRRTHNAGRRRSASLSSGKCVEHQLPLALHVTVARVRLHGGDGDRPATSLCRALPASARCGAGAAAAHAEQR